MCPEGIKMDIKAGKKRIAEMLKVIESTDIEEIYYESDGLNIGIKKSTETIGLEAATSQEETKTEIKHKKSTAEVIEVCSHSVGFFMDYIPPLKKIMAKVGDNVNKGQKIGIIESMKILKEIVAPVSGRVSKKFVKHGSPVEYGQKLFEINV